MVEKEYKVDFPFCGHLELIPICFEHPRPEACKTIGGCPIHNYTCPVCGLGVGCAPKCNCPEMRY